MGILTTGHGPEVASPELFRAVLPPAVAGEPLGLEVPPRAARARRLQRRRRDGHRVVGRYNAAAPASERICVGHRVVAVNGLIGAEDMAKALAGASEVVFRRPSVVQVAL